MSEAGVERRLTTILAADVVGYSRLMAADEAATLAELKIHRKELIEPKTAEYRGRVVKLMGDGTLMEFTSVVDAVRFAIDMQRTIAEHNAGVAEDRRITYRIGINIGDIIVDGDDLYGDGVNVASRLGKLAEPGEICVSGTGVAHYLAERYQDAVQRGRKAIRQRPGFTAAYRILCASLARTGEIEETRAMTAKLREMRPKVSIAWRETHVPYTPRAMAHFLDGTREAGIE